MEEEEEEERARCFAGWNGTGRWAGEELLIFFLISIILSLVVVVVGMEVEVGQNRAIMW